MLTAIIVESGWLAARVLRARRYDDRTDARAEAARLRYALRTGGSIPHGLDQALAEIAEAASAAGLRAASTSDSITVTVRDHGVGYSPGAASGYESRLLALQTLLEPWGTVATWSEPGGRVRVTMTLAVATVDEISVGGTRDSFQAATQQDGRPAPGAADPPLS